MSRPDDSYLDPQQLANVERHAFQLLQEASALHVFPTPIDNLMSAAKLTVVDDQVLNESMLAHLMRKAKATFATIKSALSKVVGLFDSPDRLVFIDSGLHAAKVPFVKLHEAGHGHLPHQSKVYALIHDCEKTLDPDVTDLFEREANAFASEVLFQGHLFAEEAHQSEFGMKVPLSLAKKYGASAYSAFRRYVTTSPHSCCVLVLNPPVCGVGNEFTAEVRRRVVSKSFHVTFDILPLGETIHQFHLLGHLVPVGRRMTKRREITLVDRNGDQRICSAEAFSSTYQVFLLIRDEGLRSKSGIVLLSPKTIL
jgi:Zn-dependent peptidase ImmA (M78 family)